MSLPKVISQETFDEVVLENIVEFDKSLNEAIIEATQDFEAQGVLLSNIIKEVSLSPSNDKIVHPVLDAVAVIKAATSEESDAIDCSSERLLGPLAKFTAECKLSLAHRVLASKNGAYSYLTRIVKMTKQGGGEVLCAAAFALHSLTEGNPDILDSAGVTLLADLLDQCKTDMDSDMIENLSRWCQSCTTKHEANRSSLFEAGAPHSLVSSLATCSPAHHKTRILATLKAVRSFTLDDDIRTEFGKAHENSRHLVEEEKIMQVALQLLKESSSSVSGSVAGECLGTLSSVCVRAEYCQQACDAGALEVISDILIAFPDSAILNKQSITLLATLAGDDKVKVHVMGTMTPALITKAMDTHQMSVGVCIACCSAVSMLTLRHPKHAQQLMDVGAGAGVLQAMKMHPKERQLQKLGCLAVRNLCSRSPAAAAALRDMEAEDVVKAAVAAHQTVVEDMAKSALRDMGVDVALVEQWHGKGHEIQQG